MIISFSSGDPLIGLPLFACFLKDDGIIFAEYVFPNAAVLRSGDWTKFEKLFSIAQESQTIMYTFMHDSGS